MITPKFRWQYGKLTPSAEKKPDQLPGASDSHIQLLSLENFQAICNDYSLLDKDHYSRGVAGKSMTLNELPLQPLSFKNQERTLMIFTNGLTSPKSVLSMMFIQFCFWDLCHQKERFYIQLINSQTPRK